MLRRALLVFTIAATLAVPALAQETVRVRGTIERIDGVVSHIEALTGWRGRVLVKLASSAARARPKSLSFTAPLFATVLPRHLELIFEINRRFLDHVRDFFGSLAVNPTDLATTTPGLFFTRWITHICAPVFFLLAGAGARLLVDRNLPRAQLPVVAARRARGRASRQPTDGVSLAQFNAGADIVHAAAGRTGIGAFDAAIAADTASETIFALSFLLPEGTTSTGFIHSSRLSMFRWFNHSRGFSDVP